MNTVNVFNLIMTKQSSSPNRIWKDVGWSLAILTVILIIGQVAEPTQSHAEYVGFGLAMFIIAMIEMGNHSFSEFKNDKTAVTWLTLPATTFEKWLGNFITSFILVPLAFLIVLMVSTITANLFIGIFGWGTGMPIFNPASAEGWTILKLYWIAHPILFFSAIYFKKRPILKIFGSLSLFFLAFILYVAFVGDLLFSEVLANVKDFDMAGKTEEEAFEEAFIMFGDHVQIHSDGVNVDFPGLYKAIGHGLFYAYFLFFWGLSFLRLKELEL